MLAAIAVLAAVQVVRPAQPMTSVVVAARDIPARSPLTPDDLAVTRLPTEAIAPNAVLAIEHVLGQRPLTPIAAGEPLTVTRLADDDIPPGMTAVPVRFTDDTLTSVLAPGDLVDLIAEAGVITRSGVVLRIERGSTTSAGAMVVVAVRDADVLRVARAAAGRSLWATLPG